MPYLRVPPATPYAHVRPLGLGALSAQQIYSTAVGAGFPPDVATQMTAIALRESAGNPTAHNPGVNGSENSFGLWQINIQGNPTLMAQLGITDPAQLYDPATNARAAYLLWGGNPANLNTAWYINRPGYEQAYEANLPVAQAAADAFNASLGTGVDSSSVDAASVLPNIDLSNPLVWGLGLGLLGLVVFASMD